MSQTISPIRAALAKNHREYKAVLEERDKALKVINDLQESLPRGLMHAVLQAANDHYRHRFDVLEIAGGALERAEEMAESQPAHAQEVQP